LGGNGKSFGYFVLSEKFLASFRLVLLFPSWWGEILYVWDGSSVLGHLDPSKQDDF
jgi:hypothetical protein